MHLVQLFTNIRTYLIWMFAAHPFIMMHIMQHEFDQGTAKQCALSHALMAPTTSDKSKHQKNHEGNIRERTIKVYNESLLGKAC